MTFLWQLFLITFIFAFSTETCPDGIDAACACEKKIGGWFIVCRGVSTDLNSLLASLQNARVDRLAVVQASWPILKRVVSANVRSLRIINCSVREVENGAFDRLSEVLEELVLSNNLLSGFPVFGTLPKLQSLNLNYNKLQNVSADALNGIGRLQFLRLEGNKITQFSDTALVASKSMLKLLDVSGNKLTKIPSSVVSNSGKLMYLDFSKNHISQISSFDFRNIPNLIELRLNDNALQSIENMAFKNVPALRYLLLQNNLLRDVRAINFRNDFEQLEVLDVSNNSLTKVPLLKGYQSLQQLKLDYNKINAIEEATFSFNSALQFISLQNNCIRSVADKSFLALDHLTILLLGNNLIQTIGAKTLNGVRRLQQLDLRNNTVGSIDSDAFKVVPELKVADLAFNHLKSIPNSLFWSLKNLVWLDLSYNRLSTLSKDTFVQRIPHLMLAGNFWRCDTDMDWFVEYLNKNQVSTSSSATPEPKCATPKVLSGVQLKEVIAKSLEKKLDVNDEPISRVSVKKDGAVVTSDEKVSVSLSRKHTTALSERVAKTQEGTDSALKNTNSSFSETDVVLEKEQELRNATEAVSETHFNESFNILKMYPSESEVTSVAPSLSTENVIVQPTRESVTLQTSPEVPEYRFLPNGVRENSDRFKVLRLLLPPGYDANKIPQEVVDSLRKGEVPDFALIPADLKLHFVNNFAKLFSEFMKEGSKVVDVINQFPVFDRVETNTISAYDLSENREKSAGTPPPTSQTISESYIWYCVVTVLGLTGIASAITFGAICVYKRNSFGNSQQKTRMAKTNTTDSTSRSYLPGASLLRYSPRFSPTSTTFYETTRSHFSVASQNCR